MGRKLLLLGLLRMQEMHGYQINELIDAHLGTSVQLKKPTVYKLLGNMLDDGWISYRQEQAGNYPARRVYAITTQGEVAFQQMLRENLADYRPVSYLNNIGVVYMDALPAEEAAALLSKRRADVESFAQVIRADENHQGGFQLMLSFHLCHLEAELAWLDEVIGQLKATSGQAQSLPVQAGRSKAGPHAREIIRDE
jgi:DNA-binding PadR family transcriptional regulator